MDHVEVDGLQIGLHQRGAGPDVLLLHGAVTDGRSWADQLEDLGSDFRVTAWDAPGCGGSDDPPEHWRMADFAGCLASFIDAVGLERPHVVGHSWGSTLALVLALRHPGVVRSLVLAGAYAGWAGSLPADEVERRRSLARDLAERLDDGWDPRTMPGLFSDRMSAEQAGRLTELMGDVRPAGTRVMAEALAEADLRGELAHVGLPVLVLAGALDERSSPEVGRAIHDALPGSSLVVLPGAGHEMFLEDRSGCAEAIRSFLRQVP